MGAIDFIPELLTVGTAASSVAGLYLDRVRKRIERQEPVEVQQAADEAAAGARLESSALAPPELNESGKFEVSLKELQKLVDDTADATAERIKTQLASERQKDRRVGFWSSTAFFVAGIMATVAITLYVHPLH